MEPGRRLHVLVDSERGFAYKARKAPEGTRVQEETMAAKKSKGLKKGKGLGGVKTLAAKK